ncbi:transposase family protein [Streptomyces sp. CA2R106]|uniref:transposase family protein n=1 Tax=Streptomyces sp. CA2R106 TaxID=3120153 RepID=UPI003007F2E9
MKLGPLHQHDTGRLREHLQRVPDPRSRRGRWYPLVSLLLVRARAVVSGARTVTEITEWGQRATAVVLEQLGIRRHLPGHRRAPSHATLTRLLAALDGDALDAAVGAYLAEHDHTDTGKHRLDAAAGDRGGRQGPVRLRAPTAAPPAPDVRSHPRPPPSPWPSGKWGPRPTRCATRRSVISPAQSVSQSVSEIRRIGRSGGSLSGV